MAVDPLTFVAQLKALCSEVTKDPSGESWVSSLDAGVQLCDTSLSDVNLCPTEHATAITELESQAVGLWNFSVTQKTKGSISNASNAKIRHIAFTVLELCGQGNENDASTKRLIMMGLKTGRAWLDAGVPQMSEKVLSTTEKIIQRVRRGLVEGGQAGPGEEAVDRGKLQLDQDTFTLACYRAETYVAMHCPDEALHYMMMAKDLVPKFPKQAGFLSMLCYNCGVELYQQKLYSPTILWLRESYELGKGVQTIGPRNQARTLRLLATVYLDNNPEEEMQNALNAVSLANTEHSHPAGLFLKLRILMLQSADTAHVKRCVEELLKVPELTVDLCLHTLQLINKHKRMNVVMWLIEKLLQRFEHSPDLGKLLVTNTEVLLQAGMIKEVKEFVEFCINAHHTGKSLDFAIKKRFHILFWEQAAVAYEKENYQDALEWYNYSLALYGQSDPGDVTLAKLHRNRTNCYIALKLHCKAEEAISVSLKCDPSCPQTHYIMFTLALQQNDSGKASESLGRLCELCGAGGMPDCGGDRLETASLVALAAQHALESDCVETAVKALDHLAKTSSDREQVLRSLRCLVRLSLTMADKDNTERDEGVIKIIEYIRKAKEQLCGLQPTAPASEKCIRLEADWFMKIAWNMALQCEEKPQQMKELYTLCSQLLPLCGEESSGEGRQMTCLLMSAAACLQLARSDPDADQRKLVLEECLEHITNCRDTCRKQGSNTPDTRGRETDILLLLYEFEARVQLKDSAVETVLERALTTAGSDPKTFETLAAIALEPPAHNKGVAVRALKVAIRKHLQSPIPDIQKCSKLYHSLIQLGLSSGAGQGPASREEAWGYYIEILDLVDKSRDVGGSYPEMELVWLMTKAWNCGINFYSYSRYQDAEKWCGLSMRMLKHLDTFRNNYQEHMSGIYADILAKVQT
ncbi:testis-expressed protein 11-like [Mya arenaria]|uniref:testis-expressed protein 11-like n=1 Tax=Mya arenaria TaxID=6604 RepID=UPI0022E5E6C7|nr:testis-expressed protein 11-like [Mya arenaria]